LGKNYLADNDMIIISRKQKDNEINTVYNIKKDMQIKESYGTIVGTDYRKRKIAISDKGEFRVVELPN